MNAYKMQPKRMLSKGSFDLYLLIFFLLLSKITVSFWKELFIMLLNIKHREVDETIVSEYFKYYNFLSFETFISQKSNKQCKLQTNATLTYTIVTHQFARLDE